MTACSVVVTGRDFERAAAELRARLRLDVGLHLTLVGERPLSPRADVPTLVPGGVPIPDHRAFLLRLMLGRIDLGDVAREARRQIARAREAGLVLTHLDAHQHLHVAPGIAGVIADVARESSIPYIRAPFEPGLPSTPRAAAIWCLGLLARRARRSLRARGLATSDRAIGLRHAGHLTVERLVRALDHVEGMTELVTHPGEGNAVIARAYGWGYDWDGERRALMDPRVRSELERRRIRLVRIREVISAG